MCHIRVFALTYILWKSGGAQKEMKTYGKYHSMRLLWGMCYMFCVLSFFGISVNIKEGETKEQTMAANGSKVEKSEEDTLAEDMAPKIAITFDDGPGRGCTGRLLDGLKERGVKATFFLIGENAKENPELVKRIYDEGHLIGNHTYHHVEISKVSDEKAKREIEDTNQVIMEITGEPVIFMRPPFGVWQKKLELEIDVFPVMWTIDPLDWTTENADEIVNKIVSQAEEDAIILMHDCYDSSVDAALRIIDILEKEGYEFVTVDQLILN